MTGPSTIAHHHELHAQVDRLKTLLADQFVLEGLSPEDAVKAVEIILKAPLRYALPNVNEKEEA